MSAVRPLRTLLVGAGSRGWGVYGRWARHHPEAILFVAVADPDAGRRERFALAHGIGEQHRFADVGAFIASGSDPGTRSGASAAIVASPDRAHAADALALLEADYDVLLEKPMAVSLDELETFVARARAAPGRLSVAHVLRYTPFFRAVHEVVTSGRLGEIVSVSHSEIIAWWHMAHSYVRGNWAVGATSSPAILAKCSHDLDILAWNAPAAIVRVFSVGGLLHFRPERAPAAATARCTDGCPVTDCRFDARRIYLDRDAEPWLVEALSDDPAPDARLEALRRGPYGRCVYHAGSDVVDHQAVLLEWSDGSTATLVFSGHGEAGARRMRYDGSRASLRGVWGAPTALEIREHAGGAETIEVEVPDMSAHGGHAGGDDGLMRAFVEHALGRRALPTDLETSLESHLLAFAAEEARLSGTGVDAAALRTRLAGPSGSDDVRPRD